MSKYCFIFASELILKTYIMSKAIKKVHTLEMEAPQIEISAVAKEILSTHGLDWRINKLPLQGVQIVKDGDGDEVVVFRDTDDYGLFRSDNGVALATGFKKGYTVSQNDEIMEAVLRGSAGFGDLSVSKAGALNEGRKIYIQLEIKGMSRVANDDIKKFITIIDSNDGSTGLSVGIGDLTMSCQNQFFRFYKAGQFKMRHSSAITAKIQELPNLITIAMSEQMKLINAYKTFAKTPASTELVNQWVKNLVGMDRRESLVKENVTAKAINNMENLYKHIEKEMDDKGGNLWGLHSGVTSWTTHEKQAPNRDNGRLESIMAGTNYRTNEASLNMALELVGIEL